MEANVTSAVSITCPRRQELGHPGAVTVLPGGLGQILLCNHQACDREEELLSSMLLEILHEEYLKWSETPNSTPGTVKA